MSKRGTPRKGELDAEPATANAMTDGAPAAGDVAPAAVAEPPTGTDGPPPAEGGTEAVPSPDGAEPPAPSPEVASVPMDLLPLDLHGAPLETSVSKLIEFAIGLPASDLFVSSGPEQATVAVRRLGLLKRLSMVTAEEGRRLITYVKAVAGMDVAQRLRPLDGRWIYTANQTRVDLRINTIPTLYGEDMAVRILDHRAKLLSIEGLGFHQRNLEIVHSMLSSPSGLLLVTGPTGSGKTTTLYACLNRLNDGRKKINTIEDPIEYALHGIHQSQVSPKLELDFPEMLRSVLRQAPDVIMVGEIRDPVTAETAVRAANSGQLVFATLHAHSAAAAVDSMLALGVHPHFLAASILGAISQRLLRTLCPDCRVSFDLSGTPGTFVDIRKWLAPGEGEKIYSAPGCEKCRHEGYAGQTAVEEVLRASPEIRRAINDHRSTREIHDLAVRQGTLDLRRSALLKVARGITSTEEVMRMIPVEHLLPG